MSGKGAAQRSEAIGSLSAQYSRLVSTSFDQNGEWGMTGRTVSFALALFAIASAQASSAQDIAPTQTEAEAAVGSGTNSQENQSQIIPTSAFAARDEFGDARLSPDGLRIVVRKNAGKRVQFAFYDAATLELLNSVDIGTGIEVNWFRWANNNRLVYSVGWVARYNERRQSVSRLFVYDFEKNEKRYIGFPEQGFIGDDVIFTDPAGEYVLLDVNQSIYQWPDVWRFPLDASGHEAAVKVQKGREAVSDWIADETGVVRMGYGPLRSGRTFVTYRSGQNDDWKRVARLKYRSDEAENWNIYSIFSGTDIGYALIPGEEEHEAIYEFDYSTGEPGALIYREPGQAIEAIGRDRDGRPITVYYSDDRSRIRWLDPAMERVQSQLEKALPSPQVRIISRSDDGQRMLVWSGGENDPGALYVYTPEDRHLALLASVRPDLDHSLLATPKAITYTARDGTEIHAYLTLPKGRDANDLPLILLPHGGPFGIRDMLEYNDEVQVLASRGYAVLQPNYRGSGGYGDAFEKLGEGQIGKAMQDDLDDAMDWAVAQGFADPGRVCVVGASYGGYAALWAVIRNPERYRCAASWAGVTDWKKQLRYDRDYLGRQLYEEFQVQIEGEGDFSLTAVSPARQIATLDRPVLIAHGKDDRRVPFDQYQYMVEQAAKAGKSLETLELDEGHSFKESENEQAWYDALEAFLAKHNPAD
ncbi:alpha/beta hydrolase family protein [Parerythrobacter lacustris]|uniref:Prolyl oligopeptidase family serine peptidase n=1 Tax=Parerythrobacter lacustris TaxID=2969984 RepID=A0ABT1XP27_9SPHN|nr:alpha/beta fold hydrolase [Parerythrobacter lacustris]MCR2833408.1 prolyl oligopeptidase family serine peptidase [Parerythrobacter lacustris]